MGGKEPHNRHAFHPLFVDRNLLFKLSWRDSRFDGIDSDVGHAGNQGVLFYYIPDSFSEILNLFRLGRSHKMRHPRLSLQQRLVCLLHGGIVFIREKDSELAKVYLADGSHAVRVGRRVQLIK